MYMPRTLVKEDLILDEDVLSQFDVKYDIEMFIKTFDNFGGPDDTITKFGLDVNDELILTVHADRFQTVTGMDHPLEGDLIWFPLSQGLFEIKYVENEQPFYQVGKNYVFDLTCEIFQYSGEKIDTGVAAIDQIESENAYSIDLLLAVGGLGTYTPNEPVYQGGTLATATAKAIVSSWTPGTRKLRVYNIVGTFATDTYVTGDTSGANWDLTSTDDQLLPTVPFADNKILETDGDSILDFSEMDPWSEGDL
ncbi:uncharacterized protein METZ01_LOCUS12334 [marine metagenome]|uniref:Neck protein n=1 Tax=marine metagenome TaxID=408172 RepID=A0A381NY31_9ZZZZ